MSSILSVSQINRYVSLKLNGDLKLKSITVRGELSDFKVHYKSGHAYFSLKDDSSLIGGIMFSRSVDKLGFEPRDGMSVLCTGNVQVYEPSGKYQIVATELTPVGAGAQLLQLKALKESLEKQGVFAKERKKPLPYLPKKIAVVTSLGAAALQDVLNILGRRYPIGEVLIFPAHVQGELAHNSLANALKQADSSGADVIILTRGGGSSEELSAFNTAEVATAVASCNTPVISAVGHETDTTLADCAADMRASTPSAAAELCAPSTDILARSADVMELRLKNAFEDCLKRRGESLSRLEMRLRSVSPDAKILNSADKLDGLEARLRAAVLRSLDANNSKLEKSAAALSALSPYNVLERGYTLTMKDGTAVMDKSQLSAGDEITVRFKDFAVTAEITGFTDV